MSAETRAIAPSDALDVELFISGAWCGGASSQPIIDPSTGEPVGRVALADRSALDEAIRAADQAFPAWAAMTGEARGAILRDAADLLAQRLPEIAAVLSRESGKTDGDATGELARSVDTLRWNGEQAGRTEGRILPGRAPGSHRLLVPTPLGVVAAFTAWNFPAVLTTRKLGAILAAGCTAVLKAAESAPATAAAIVRVLADAGAPAGTVNLVFGDPATVSQHVISAPEVRAVTFTGSTAVGRIIAGQAAAGLKRTVLELGGHAPVIIDADADALRAVRTTLPAKLGSAGQSCVAPTRYFVHRSHLEAVTRTLVDGFKRQIPGETVGPVIDEGRLDVLDQLVSDAQQRGATLLCGGHRLDRPGYFFAPTLLADVPADAEIMHEEPFGPIATINAFDTLDEAITAANATTYSFAAYVFTRSLITRQRVLADLEASNIGINQLAPSLPDAPIGGMRDSGVGYEGGRDGVAAFQHLRLISETL
jgi:succinate-semialdehyde dehydrogenase / glutarate-semialdehyde dehydrogenase